MTAHAASGELIVAVAKSAVAVPDQEVVPLGVFARVAVAVLVWFAPLAVALL